MLTKDPEVSKIANLVPYQITKGDNGDAWVKVRCCMSRDIKLRS